MRLIRCVSMTWAATAVGTIVVASTLAQGAARAEDKTYVMKISTPTVNDVPDTFAKNFGAAVEKDFGWPH